MGRKAGVLKDYFVTYFFFFEGLVLFPKIQFGKQNLDPKEENIQKI